MGQLVVAAAGAVVGGMFGMPQLGWTIGAMIGGALFAPVQKNQGPRLGDLTVGGSSYGSPIPYVQGHPRIAGNIVWASAKREIATTQSQGKGGGGAEYTNYTYEVDLLILLTENVIDAVPRVWSNGELVYNIRSDADVDTLIASNSTSLWDRITVYTGVSSQLPDPTYEAAVGTDNAPAYRGRGSVFIEGLQLGSSGQIPNLTFEVATSATITSQTSELLHVPLTADFVDTVSPAATVTGPLGADPYNFTDELLTVVLTEGETFDVSWSGTKIYANHASLLGKKFTIQAAIQLPAWVDTPDNMVFFGYGSGGQSHKFAMRMLGSSHMRLLARVSYPSDTVYTDLGPASNELMSYKIVFDADNATNYWYVADGVTEPLVWRLVFTNSYSRYNGDIWASSPSPGNLQDLAGSTLIKFSHIRAYTGDAVYTSDVVTLVDLTLSAVVTALCERSGLVLSQFSVAGIASITRPVNAMAISQISTVRAALEMLMATYFFDAVLSDKIYFVARGSASVVTIGFDDLACSSDGANVDPLPLVQMNELEIPAQMALSYNNINTDYEIDTEKSDRLITGQENNSVVQLPMGFTATEAKIIVDAMLLDKVVGSLSAKVNVDLGYTKYEPTDIIVLTDEDTSTYRMRIVRKTESSGILTLDCVLDDASILTQFGVTTEGVGSTSVAPLPVIDFKVLDIPILRDADDFPGHYIAVKSANGQWSNAAVYSGSDGLTFVPIDTINTQAVMGECLDTLDDWTGGNVWDEYSSVTVSIGSGTLSSATRDEVLNDHTVNAAVIGSEIVQYRTATLSSTGVYVLTSFIRGRRGTEWAMTGHDVAENFVSLSTSGIRFLPLQTSDLGRLRYYKVPSAGQRLSTINAKTITPLGVGCECFSPVDARANRTTTDTWITWIRRTRLSTSLVGSTAISAPLGEDTESYEVDIYDDSDFTTVLRTIAVTVIITSPGCSYTLAQQTTDFGSGQSVLYVKIYQMSAITGRGYPLTATI